MSRFTNIMACELIHESCLRNIKELRGIKSLALKIHCQSDKVHSHFEILTSLSKEEINVEDFSVISSITENVLSDGEICFLFVELVVDAWLKFGAKEFMISYRPKNRQMNMYFNSGLMQEELDAYWKGHKFDGYYLDGSFWDREWSFPKQKSHGGKIS
jgi:hypothetical protein